MPSLPSIVEALLIASDEPLSTSELARIIRATAADKALDDQESGKETASSENSEADSFNQKISKIDEATILQTLEILNEEYKKNTRSFRILERAKGWRIYTQPDYADFIAQLFPSQKKQRLSAPAMETLAIVTYRQPVTKASIEAVRGVSCDGMIQKLLDQELIKIDGRANLPGRPILYATTGTFFEHFGIKSIDDLPNNAELRAIKLPQPELDPVQ